METGPFFGLIAIIIVVAAWAAQVRVRERAHRLAADTCMKSGLQFLDGTVALVSMRIARDGRGRFVVERVYGFDYSEDGFGRRGGCVVMHGLRVEAVVLEANRRA